MSKQFSIIIPVLHESRGINDLVRHLRALENAEKCELIVVDGSAEADTVRVIADSDVLRLSASPGRAKQMNAGAAAASGDILLFLHADTYLPDDALTQIDRVMNDGMYAGGAFDLGIDAPRQIYRLIAAVASARARFTRIPYGDQAIFIKKKTFHRLGCYPEIPIMEDVALMEQIKKSGGRIYIVPRCVATSPRRWEQKGIIRTTMGNWFLLATYYLGVSPDVLVRVSRRQEKRSPESTQTGVTRKGCVLFFVKSPEHVPVKSRLAESIGTEAARDLYKNFVLDMLETLASVAAKTGLALYVCVHPPEALPEVRNWLGDDYRYQLQEGKDLGERMKNAFLTSFAAGYGKTLIIGSDTPDLTGEVVAEGFERLERGGTVIGPAHDGGYYLIGFRSDAFLPAVFKDIPWSTDEVFTATLQIFRHAGSDVSVLPPWRDIDTSVDLQDFQQRHGNDHFTDSRTMRCLRSRKEKV